MKQGKANYYIIRDSPRGKYVFAHVDEETVNGWDEQHNIEAE